MGASAVLGRVPAGAKLLLRRGAVLGRQPPPPVAARHWRGDREEMQPLVVPTSRNSLRDEIKNGRLLQKKSKGINGYLQTQTQLIDQRETKKNQLFVRVLDKSHTTALVQLRTVCSHI